MDERRHQRMMSFMVREISEIIRTEVSDPRIGLVTISEVTLSRDMRYATVTISAMGTPEEQARTLAGINSAAGFIRRHLAQRMATRISPQLRFVADPHTGYRIDDILADIRKGQADGEDSGTSQ